MADEATVLLGLGDIAEIAGVGRSAVSNWRRRHPTFPVPHQTGASGDLFAADEIERWLLENGKISTGLPPERLLWGSANLLREVWSPEQIMRFYVSALVYLVACRRSADLDRRIPVDVPAELHWKRLREQDPAARSNQLPMVAMTLEQRNPLLHGLLTLGFLQPLPPDPRAIDAIFDGLQALLEAEPDSGEELFRTILEQFTDLDRFSQAYFTPRDLVQLMVDVAAPTGRVILDPACGRGGLLMHAVHATGPAQHDSHAIGLDVNEEVVTTARARFFVHDMPAELSVRNMLRMPLNELPKADTVLLDPPYGMQGWGDAELYRDGRWSFGSPPPKSADFAWLQVALRSLTKGGRAVVALPVGSTFRGGQEQRIREALVKAGHVEAVIHLPPNMRVDTSIRLALWILRETAQPDTPVLLIDASKLGTAGRTSRELKEDDVRVLTHALRSWRAEAKVVDNDLLLAAAVHATELQDGDLTPARYLQLDEEADLGGLAACASYLARELAENRRRLDPLIDRFVAEFDQEGEA